MEDSSASLWGGGHCGWNSCSRLRVARELGGGVGEEGEVFDSRAWGNQILSPPAQRGEMSQRDRGGRPLPRGQHRAPLCLRHLPPPSRRAGERWLHRSPDSGGSRGEDPGGRSSARTPCGGRGERGGTLVADPGGREWRERGAGRPISGFGRPILGFGRPNPGFGRPLLVADRGCLVGDAEAGPALALVEADAIGELAVGGAEQAG